MSPVPIPACPHSTHKICSIPHSQEDTCVPLKPSLLLSPSRSVDYSIFIFYLTATILLLVSTVIHCPLSSLWDIRYLCAYQTEEGKVELWTNRFHWAPIQLRMSGVLQLLEEAQGSSCVPGSLVSYCDSGRVV